MLASSMSNSSNLFLMLFLGALLTLWAARTTDSETNANIGRWARTKVWRTLLWSGGAIAAVAAGASATRLLDPADSHEVIRQRATWGSASHAFALLAVVGLVALLIGGFVAVTVFAIRNLVGYGGFVDRIYGVGALLRAALGWALASAFTIGLMRETIRHERGPLALCLAKYALPAIPLLWICDWRSLKVDVLAVYRAAVDGSRTSSRKSESHSVPAAWDQPSLDDVLAAIEELRGHIKAIQECGVPIRDHDRRLLHDLPSASTLSTWSKWWTSRPRPARRQ
jgi:hypothetical protein